MKLYITILLILIASLVQGQTTFYVSNSSGNDANNGTSEGTAWKTLAKVSTTDFNPGDKIYFKRGDTWYGTLVAKQGGNSGNRITYGSYGSGDKPVITGFTDVTSWVNVSGNIWESTNAVSTLATLNVVLINGVSTPMGRYPNADATYPFFPNFFRFQSVGGTGFGNITITSSSLTEGINWTGADACVFVNQWTIDRTLITAQSGNTLSIKNNTTSVVAKDWQFFIQNDIRTLDVQNEWYYNPSTKKIRIYSISEPIGVKITSVENTFSSVARGHINVNDLAFTGANNNTIRSSSTANISFNNCSVTFSGAEAMWLTNSSSHVTVDNCYISDCGGTAIMNYDSGPNYIITNNTIKRVGLVSTYKANDYSTCAIESNGGNTVINKNIIDSSIAYGISFRGNNVEVRNNFVNHSGLLKGDCAAIYTGHAGEINKIIDGNIVMNIEGNGRGKRGDDPFVFGIYIDDLGTSTTVTNNTIINSAVGGLYLHGCNFVTAKNNTIYNTGGINATWAFGGIAVDGGLNFTDEIHDNHVTDNIVFSVNPYQYVIDYYSENGSRNEAPGFGVLDSNYYVKIGNPSTLISSRQAAIGLNGKVSLPTWQAGTGKDIHSKGAPTPVIDINNLRVEYNATDNPVTIPLSGKYLDARGMIYDGTITLQPWRSAILIKRIVLAGDNQTVTLPTDFVNLSATLTNAGTVSSKTWSKVSGGFATISQSGDNATVTGLTEGEYLFKFQIVQSGGKIYSDEVKVTVIGAPPPAPTVNAGVDQTITIPTNSVSVSATVTGGGTFTSRLWSKLSGLTATISQNGDNATITNLIPGDYYFRFTAIQGGVEYVDDMKVTVKSATAPTANAGIDQSVQLPVASKSLTGSSTHANGMTATYLWTKVSGNGTQTISGSTTLNPTINGMTTSGVYTFKLTVTQNDGQIATDEVRIYVDPPTPVVNAGAYQSITLPINYVNLTANITDGGTVTSKTWTKLNGPFATITQSGNNATITALVQGTYNFRFTIVQGGGAVYYDDVQVIVNAAIIEPTVSAGANQAITGASTATLSGSHTFTGGVTSAWSQLSGPSCTIVSPNTLTTSVMGISTGGTYTFELTVTQGAVTKSSTMQVVKTNLPPTVDAGPDQIIRLPVNSVSVNADVNNTENIISKGWSLLFGNPVTITPVGDFGATISNLSEGEYTLRYAFIQEDPDFPVDPAKTIGASDDMKIKVLPLLPTNVIKSKGGKVIYKSMN